MTDLLQLVLAGVSVGSTYALVAIGFVAIFTVSEVINLAQGELASLAALVAIAAASSGWPLVGAAAAGVAAAALCGGAIERFTIAPIAPISPLRSIILTLGVSTALKAAMLLAWGPQSQALPGFPGEDLMVGSVSIRAQELWIIGITALVAGAVIAFDERTRWGKVLRACSEQPVAARLIGISPSRASLVSFLIAGVTAGIAGVMASPVYFTSWDSGLTLGLKGFVAAALAGLVSYRGAVLGGVTLGVLESLTAGYVDTGLRDAVAFVVLIALLVTRPQGLWRARAQARV